MERNRLYDFKESLVLNTHASFQLFMKTEEQTDITFVPGPPDVISYLGDQICLIVMTGCVEGVWGGGEILGYMFQCFF